MTNDAKNLLTECAQRGIQLELRGQMLFVAPEEKTTPRIVEQLRKHKFEIIVSLEHQRRSDAMHIAKQILCGEFTDAPAATVASIVERLRDFDDPMCRRALVRLTATKNH